MAIRTWVSGVGDDANPGSRTAPCKTFAGAISKTDIGGEIDVLDPGGFGAVTITKSVTIDGGTGSGWGAILAAGTSGIIINAANAVVTLRHLSLNGAGTGIAGIRILAAQTVIIEDCVIFNFRATAGTDAGTGIRDARTTGGVLYISRTTVQNCAQTGIVISPSSTTNRVSAILDGVQLVANSNSGIFVGAVGLVSISNSIIVANLNSGLTVQEGAGVTTEVNLHACVMNQNGTAISAATGAAVVRISDCSIINNGAGITTGGGGVVASFGNNRITANGAGNAPSPGAGIALQ